MMSVHSSVIMVSSQKGWPSTRGRLERNLVCRSARPSSTKWWFMTQRKANKEVGSTAHGRMRRIFEQEIVLAFSVCRVSQSRVVIHLVQSMCEAESPSATGEATFECADETIPSGTTQTTPQ